MARARALAAATVAAFVGGRAAWLLLAPAALATLREVAENLAAGIAALAVVLGVGQWLLLRGLGVGLLEWVAATAVGLALPAALGIVWAAMASGTAAWGTSGGGVLVATVTGAIGPCLGGATAIPLARAADAEERQSL